MALLYNAFLVFSCVHVTNSSR